MNIVKLKDIILKGDDNFNNKLKGKYAYWIQMRYIVSFDDLTYLDYIQAEQDPSILNKKNIYYIDSYDCDGNCMYLYIDSIETNRINSIGDYIVKNNFQPDADITVDELKVFRTWLAKNLLLFDQNADGTQAYDIYNEKTTIMLQYYANGMYDDVISQLDMFVKTDVDIIYNNKSSNCGCCGDTNISSLYNTNMVVCEPVSKYRTYIYHYMVEVFSDMNFWMQFSKEFLMDFKKYIDNIVRYNFPLVKSQYDSDFVDCGCASSTDARQQELMEILRRLSVSLQCMIDDDLQGHKNYIMNSLIDWSKLLYENMEWA